MLTHTVFKYLKVCIYPPSLNICSSCKGVCEEVMHGCVTNATCDECLHVVQWILVSHKHHTSVFLTWFILPAFIPACCMFSIHSSSLFPLQLKVLLSYDCSFYSKRPSFHFKIQFLGKVLPSAVCP